MLVYYQNYLIICDLEITKIQYDEFTNCYVHMGFYNQYVSLKKNVNIIINNNTDKTFIFTGHSLGGAIASLLACRFFNNYSKIKEKSMCITFGSPAIGNDNFCFLYNLSVTNSYRFVNHRDPIPESILIFKHPILPIYLHKNSISCNKKTKKLLPNYKKYIMLHTYNQIKYSINI